MNIVKSIDIFAKPFTFTIFNKRKYKTYFGSLLSLLMLCLVTTLAFLFGQNFFYKKNPKIIFENQFPIEESYSVVSDTNFTIMWRLEDFTGAQLDFKGKLYPRIRYFEYERDPKTKEFIEKDELLPQKTCDQVIPKQNHHYFDAINFASYFCFNFPSHKQYRLGGSWTGSFLYYYSLEMYLCDTMNFSGNCTSKKDFIDFIDNPDQVFISISYPEVVFQAENISEPFHIKYGNFYKLFSTSIQKTDTQYFETIRLVDDLGWIFSDIREETAVSYSHSKYDISFFNYWANSSLTSGIYYYLFYLDNKTGQYKRSFMKIQELAASIGGIMKLIVDSTLFVYSFYNSYKLKREIAEKIFCVQASPKLKIEKEERISRRNKVLVAPKIEIKSKGERNANIDVSNDIIKDINSNALESHREIDTLPTKLKYSFSVWKIIFKPCRKNRATENERLNVLIYEKAQTAIREKLDITSYFKVLKEVEVLKKINLNSEQQILFEQQEKEQISENESASQKDRIQDALNYLKRKNDEGTFSPIDKYLYTNLRADLLERAHDFQLN